MRISKLSRKILPVFLQSEITECGLACIAMIGSYHGHEINLPGLRFRHPISNRGTNLKNLIHFADGLNLASRPLKLDLDHVPELQTPCILHWDLNHFVVLSHVSRKGYTIHDPAIGKRVLNREDFGKHFTGVALELTPNNHFNPMKEKRKISTSDIFENVRGVNLNLTQVFCLSTLLLILTLGVPILMQFVIDEVFVTYDKQLLLLITTALVFLTAFRAAISYIRGSLLLFLGQKLSNYFANSSFRHLLRLPMHFFERRHIGDIISRFNSLEPIKKFLTEGMIEAMIDGLMVLLMLILMAVYSWKLTALAIIAVLLYLVSRMIAFPAFRVLSEESIIAKSKEQSNFIETVRGIQSIKLFGGENERHSLWQNHLTRNLTNETLLGRFRIGFQSFHMLLSGLERAAIIGLGAYLVLDQEISAGMLIAFLSYKDQFSEKTNALIEYFLQAQMLQLHLDRIGDILLFERDKYLDSSGSAVNLKGGLSVKNLSYRYDEQSPFLFKALDLYVKPSENIAIIGPSGCGKTTLVKVLLGLLPAEDGQILLDEHPIQSCRKSYQSQVATVMQDDHLLSGSIIENIAFFDPNPTIERVLCSAQLACIHEDIMAMPMQYNSLVGDMGSSVSGGQKQRILLARALYRKPKILFLDEATSHLDSKLERAVNEGVRNLNLTRITIAHRIETILSADRIFKLEHGKLLEVEKNSFFVDHQ